MYADQPIRAAELDLLNTPALQRLYDLHQLGLTDRVFIDASHSRIQHVVGVLEQADKITKAIIQNLRADPTRSLSYGSPEKQLTAAQMALLVENRQSVIRFIGLLHDLTHAPYGHTVEDEINLVVCKHDEPKRQAEAFYRLLCQYAGWLAVDAGWPIEKNGTAWTVFTDFLDDPTMPPPADCEAVAEFAAAMLNSLSNDSLCLFWRLNVNEIICLLGDLHVAMTALLHLELLHKVEPKPKHFPDKESYPFQQTIESILVSCGHPLRTENRFEPERDAYMLDIIGNTVCADLLDYAHRDSHFANIKLAYDTDRIAENFTLVSWNATTYHPRDDKEGKERRKVGAEDPFSVECIRTAISLFTHKLRTDTLGELLNLLNVRLYLYERVIFNPTKCAADAMLGTALQLLGWRPLLQGEDNKSELLPEPLRHVGDAVFLESISNAARMILKTGAQITELSATRASLEKGGQSLQVDLAVHLAARRCDPTCEESAKENSAEEIRAGLTLLNRLKARRFYRPVFRVLQNAKLPGLDVDAAGLAEKFGDAQTRFIVEREIESSLSPSIPAGSVVIHCPEADPARKVADALVVGPDETGHLMTRKVRHIKDIDGSIFGHHQKATEAATAMYGAIWRLVVFVAPEYLTRQPEIAAAAGRVIVRHLDKTKAQSWPNDPNLEREFEVRYKERQGAATLGGRIPCGARYRGSGNRGTDRKRR